MSRMRTLLSTSILGVLATSCTGGINAGEEGGLAFIVFAAMLLVVLAVLWLVLGRED
jgi:hypothetical protein